MQYDFFSDTEISSIANLFGILKLYITATEEQFLIVFYKYIFIFTKKIIYPGFKLLRACWTIASDLVWS